MLSLSVEKWRHSMHDYRKEGVFRRPSAGTTGLIMCMIILADCVTICRNKLFTNISSYTVPTFMQNAFQKLMDYSECAQSNKTTLEKKEFTELGRIFMISFSFFFSQSYQR